MAKVSLRTEAVAGITTFFTMSYIVVVNPSILSTAGTGMPFAGVMTATVFQPYIFALGVLTTLFSFVLIAVFLIVSGLAVRRSRAKAIEEDNADTLKMSAAAVVSGD